MPLKRLLPETPGKDMSEVDLVLRNIFLVRRAREYSQEFMAYKIGVSQNTYSKIEAGKTPLTLPKFFLIAEVLEIVPTEFMKPMTIEAIRVGYPPTGKN
jgi:transcriptional regulator with XRE-family HTH domain